MSSTVKTKEHTHATPHVYLKRFAVAGMLVTQRPGAEESPVQRGTPVVGVPKKFYTLQTPKGGSNELEDALSKLEDSVGGVFDRLDRGDVPLAASEKVVLAEFIGAQICRGVTYRELHKWMFQQREPYLRERVRELYCEHAPERIKEADRYDVSVVAGHNEVLKALVGTSQLMTNVLVNMRWQFIRWNRPVLLSSDQPALCWHAPHQSSPWGCGDAVEIRMPLSPTVALVASWHDGHDPSVRTLGDGLAAMSMNHHVERHAVDWLFWQPGNRPAAGSPRERSAAERAAAFYQQAAAGCHGARSEVVGDAR